MCERRLSASRLVGFLASLLAVTGCITIEGESSGARLERLRESYLFEASDRFYPDGLPEDPARVYPDLGAKELAEIEREMNAFVSSLLALHVRSEAEIERLLGRPVRSPSTARVRVVNTGQPIANIESDGLLKADVIVAQAMFRAALLSALTGEVDFIEDEEILEGPESERDVLAKFFVLKERIETMEGHTLLGDAFATFDDELESPWFESVDLERAVEPLERRYAGATLFFLAHELGHAAFDHLQPGALPRDQARFEETELAADAYAVVLLSRLLANVAPFNSDFFGSDDWIGYQIFLSSAYDLAGFSDVAGGGRFTYPPTAERERLARRMLEQTRAESPNIFDLMLGGLEAARAERGEGE